MNVGNAAVWDGLIDFLSSDTKKSSASLLFVCKYDMCETKTHYYLYICNCLVTLTISVYQSMWNMYSSLFFFKTVVKLLYWDTFKWLFAFSALVHSLYHTYYLHSKPFFKDLDPFINRLFFSRFWYWYFLIYWYISWDCRSLGTSSHKSAVIWAFI